jgi:HD superfamily phosphodiesterase
MCGHESGVSSLTELELRLLRLAKPYLQVRENESHTENAIEFALRLLGIYEGDRVVVVPALILHDTGWSRVTAEVMARSFRPHPDMKSLKLHEDESVRIAAAILGDVEFDTGRSGEIMEIIDGHDTRAEALSLNDKIVKDADKLTRYGKGFLFLTRYFSISPWSFKLRLKKKINTWFFLDASREMAREELKRYSRKRSGSSDTG